jgi:predicted secreted protein
MKNPIVTKNAAWNAPSTAETIAVLLILVIESESADKISVKILIQAHIPATIATTVFSTEMYHSNIAGEMR